MKLDKLSEMVYANTEGTTGGNVGIISLKEQVIVVDAQYPVSGVDFRQSISTVTQKPVTHLLLTHYHSDHVFGNQAFEDCEIVAHHLLKKRMEVNLLTSWAPGNLEKMLDEIRRNRPERAWLYEGLKIVLPTTTFEDRYAIDNSVHVEMIHTGGHTDCSSMVYIPDDKTLFAGDLIFAQTFPWAGDPSVNPDAWIDAFQMILKMDIEIIIPGHGPLCNKSEVETQLSFFQAVKKDMLKLIAEGASLDEGVEYDGYPDFYESDRARRENSLRQWYMFWTKRG